MIAVQNGACRVLGLVVIMCATLAQAATISGRVVSVTDGDTLTVLDRANTQHKIRLSEIDAPERRQPYGQRSRQTLADLCFRKTAEVLPVAIDRYRRTVARVSCDGVDANAFQVRAGMAWVYERYATGRALHRLQDVARSGRIGLWQDASPIPPWAWRRKPRIERSGQSVN